MCAEFTQCYGDVNICLWTDGSELTQSAAQTACQQRDNSFQPRVTNSNIQSKLAEFRSAVRRNSPDLLGSSGFWIDVSATSISSFHWIDGSPLAGWSVSVLMCFLHHHIQELHAITNGPVFWPILYNQVSG